MQSNPDSPQQIRGALDQWLAAFNAKDIATLLSLYDSESVYANAASPLMRGADEIRPWYEGAFASVTGTLECLEEQIFVEGAMGLFIGKYLFRQPEASTDSDPGSTGRVALVFRRAQDGAWRLLFDMDNNPPDVAQADFD